MKYLSLSYHLESGGDILQVHYTERYISPLGSEGEIF
jgi:hypothetical protein